MMVNSAALISAPFLFFLLLQVYTGDYEFGLRQGTGKLTLLDGRIYEGAWLADKKHGQGVCKVRGGLGLTRARALRRRFLRVLLGSLCVLLRFIVYVH